MAKINWKSIAGTVGRAAPAAGAALVGPAGAAVGAVIASKLGTAPTPAAVQAAIKADPGVALKLAEIEKDLAIAGLQDTQHARTIHGTHWMTWLIPIVLLLLFACAGASVFMLEVPAGNQRIADLMLGSLLGMTASGVAYWVGSSSGSATKQAQLDARR
jgi:hypothetical protein